MRRNTIARLDILEQFPVLLEVNAALRDTRVRDDAIDVAPEIELELRLIAIEFDNALDRCDVGESGIDRRS